ncbi:unnamed protein product [Fusarium langsethiae]|nr:unnamed protein product [Fusarium langsethiae]
MRATFFALSALPFHAFAQYPVPDAAPAASESTSTSQAFIPQVIDTSKEVPVDLHLTSSDAIVVPKSTTEAVHVNPETTTQLPPVVQGSTTQQAIGQGTAAQVPPVQGSTTGLPIVVDSSTRTAPVIDITTGPVSVVGISTGSALAIDTTQPIVQGTTTGTSPVVDTTTGTAPVIDTTQPVAQDTTTQPIVQSTTTGQPIVADTTSKQQPPVQPTTMELEPPNVDTTTWLIVEDTSNQPINQTPGSQTPSRGPVDQDTTREQQSPVDNTTTGVPPVETTTQQTSVQDTTTTAAGQPVKITEESKPSTKDGQPAITQPPTTTAAAAAIASVSSVSSQVAALIPIINKWAEDPKSLTDATNKKVEDTHDDIIASPENPSLFRYEARADQLANQVTGIIPGALSGGVYGYFPRGNVESTGRGFLGRTIVEFDMLDGFIASEQDPTKLQALGRWRFWVEENIWATHSFNVYDDFSDHAGAEAGTPSNGNQKRAEDDAVHECLVRGDSTATTSAGPPSTDRTTTSDASSTEKAATTSDATSSTDTSADSTTDGETTETVGTTTTKDKAAEATTTRSDTSLPTSTPSTLITTTRASSDAVASGVTIDASTTSEEARTYYPCVIYGGPRVSKPYCQCSTTVSGKQYVTTASMIDSSCVDYTSFPSPVVPVTDAPLTQTPIETPFTTTEDGTVLVYSAYTLEYFNLDSFHVTATGGYGVPSTVSTPLPSQTAVDNGGGGQCGTSDSLSKDGFGDACDRAINGFDGDTVYTGYTSRYSRLTKGILMFATWGQAACVANFECDDYGIGMKGSDIIAAREKAKKDDGIWICGHIRLSNSCSVVMDYCTNCHGTG